jgi:hypothetical protein
MKASLDLRVASWKCAIAGAEWSLHGEHFGRMTVSKWPVWNGWCCKFTRLSRIDPQPSLVTVGFVTGGMRLGDRSNRLFIFLHHPCEQISIVMRG